MNFAALFKFLDTAVALGSMARRLKTGEPPPPRDDQGGAGPAAAPPSLRGHLETRLANVLVAALKETFDRDHARLELERAHLEEQRRRAEEDRKRAEEAMRLELRRQAVDREIGRLRLVGGTALVGWIASVALLAARLDAASVFSRAAVAVGWALLLASLGAAFMAQGRLGAAAGDASRPLDAGRFGTAAVWLLVAGLAASAVSLLL